MTRTRTGLALAALASIATLTACGNQSNGDEGSKKEPTGSGTPTQTTSQPPTKAGVIDLTKLEKGDAPTVPWIENGDIRFGDGGGLDLAGGGARQVAELGDNWLVTDFQVGEIVLNGPGGEQLGTWPAGSGFVVNPEGTAAAWVTDTLVPMVLTEGSKRPTQLTEFAGQTASAVALLGDDCGAPETDADAGGCSVFANVTAADGESSSFWVSDSHGIVDRAVPTVVAGADVIGEESGVQYAGMTVFSDDGSCSSVFNDEHAGPAWSTCDLSLDDFSADGSKLLAGPAYRDGFGDKEIAILSASDGKVLAQPEVHRDASITSTVWEDADHVLAVVYQNGEWAIVRIGTDGSVELAIAPQAGSDEEGLVLATR